MDNKQQTYMIFGAPGCGKTTYLMRVLESLLEQYSPQEIAFASFTRKGCYEGRDRAMQLFGYKEEEFPYFRTIHSLAFRSLEVSKHDMISKRHYKDFSRAMGMNFVGYYTEDFVNNDDRYLFFNSLEKNNPRMAANIVESLNFKKYLIVKRNYERFKREFKVRDFDDLIIDFIDEGKPLPVKVAIIDEAQDLTSLQWRFCEVAFKDCEKIYIAGDDDQAIYEWSGADIKYFLNKTKGSNLTVLDKTYRLPSRIYKFANTISTKITERVKKQYKPIKKGGKVFFYNSIEDLQINNQETYYFLSRNNYFLTEYKEYLYKLGLVFTYKNKDMVSRPKYNAIRKYEYLRQKKPQEMCTDLSIKNYLKVGAKLGNPWYEVFNLDLDESNYYRNLFKNKADINKSSISVNTIHGVKGGEADNVVLKLDVTKNVFENLNGGLDALNSELRCLYVGITRAKKNLHIIHSNSKYGMDRFLINDDI